MTELLCTANAQATQVDDLSHLCSCQLSAKSTGSSERPHP